MRPILLIPNLLSAARLVIAALFPLAQLDARPWLVLAAALTDLLDGVIARRFHATSWAGGLLDALADKAFALTLLITLTIDGRIPPPFLPLLLSRDITVAAIAAYAAIIRRYDAFRKMPSRTAGRVATAALFALFLLLTFTDRPTSLDRPAILLCGALLFLAAADYFHVFLRAYRQIRTT